MSRLTQEDFCEIMELFDEQLRILWRIPHLERIKMRRRVLNVLFPFLNAHNQKTETVMGKVKRNLQPVISAFFDTQGFLKQLSELLMEKLER